jgi:spermidine synthase
MRPFLLLSLFFVSGVSALIYELVWQRLLHLTLGVSTLAVSAVLAAFMGGLALGARLFGRWADSTTRPFRLYALLEAGIGLTALFVQPVFAAITQLYELLYNQVQPGIGGGTLLRLAAALLVLLVPASLIGGTLPVMARLVGLTGRSAMGRFAVVYCVNTLGGVVGTALTGFLLLHYLGMRETLWLAAALNGAVTLGAVSLGCREIAGNSKSAPIDEPHIDAETVDRVGVQWRSLALACAAATGAGTFGFEVTWTRILGIFTSNSSYAFALMLTVLLLGLGLGSLLQARLARRTGDAWWRLAVSQWLLAGSILAPLPFLQSSPAWVERASSGTSTVVLFLAELSLATCVLFLPSVLVGMSFPLLVAGVARDPRRFGAWLGSIYATNTLGCIAGAILTGAVLIPWLGLHTTMGLLIALAIIVGVVASMCSSVSRSLRLGVGLAVGLTAVVVWPQIPAAGFYKSPPGPGAESLFYQEGNNGTVSVLRDAAQRKWLLVDGQPVAGTGRTIMIDQKMLAHLPLLLHPAPRRALTVGFGSGGTSHSMTLHGIDVDCVEIERAVPAAASLFLSENRGVLEHPRFHMVIDDARSWLRVAPTRYDVIVTDCTNIQYKSNGDLYTIEYFGLMKDKLSENGLAAAWVPANGIEPADLKTLLRSFQHVFPHTSVWFMNTLATDFLIVIGTPDKLTVDVELLRRRMAPAEIHQDLEEVGMADPYRLACTLITTDSELAAYVGTGDLNTDDHPILSYTTYGATFRSTVAANLVGLLAARADPTQLVLHAENETLLLRNYAASNEILLGHVAHQQGNESEALRHYAACTGLLPADKSIRELVFTAYRHIR